MAVTRKAAKPDIRALNLIKDSLEPEENQTSKTSHTPDPISGRSATEVKRELWRLLACAMPLIIALVAASYLDTTRHWVVPLAERLLSLGA
jgi:hypothetical protein